VQTVLLVNLVLNICLSLAFGSYFLTRRKSFGLVKLFAGGAFLIALWQGAFVLSMAAGSEPAVLLMWSRITFLLGIGVSAIILHLLVVSAAATRVQVFLSAGYGIALLGIMASGWLPIARWEAVLGMGINLIFFIIILRCIFFTGQKFVRLDGEQKTGIFFIGLAGLGGVAATFWTDAPGFFPLFGALAITGFLIAAAHLISPFQALELRVLSVRAFRWLAQFFFSVLPPLLALFYMRPWFDEQKNLFIAFALLVIFYLFLAYLSLIQPMMSRLFGRAEQKKHRSVRSFFASISTLISLEDLTLRTDNFFKKTFLLQSSRLYLFNEQKQKCFLVNSPQNIKDGTPKEILLSNDQEFWEYWKDDNRILSAQWSGAFFENSRMQRLFSRIAKDLNSDVFFPLVFAGNFLGFFALSSDASRESLQSENLRLLDGIQDELSIAFSNSILFQQTKSWNVTLEKRIRERTQEEQALHDRLAKERNTAKMFNRLTVRREIEMIELKKKINEMKTRQEKSGII